jgi:hypothetical protein
MWDDGVPVLENMNGEDPEEEYYRGCSSPKYGDYDHHEEAS